MSRIALYQKYRSSTFEEVVGQEYAVRSIRNAVHSGQVGHAYLFCGPRGTGKTTMARLLAKAVNCDSPQKAPCGECENCRAAEEGSHPDIIEINAANETHVEDIRDLIDRARLASMLGKHKIYIIDEVHQLSSSAASALLKTLEEPPAHVIFILATTDPQKLLPTIISRCQRFDFTKVEKSLIQKHLLHIASQEGFELESGAADKIAELADGGMRDALSILEQAVSYSEGKITEEDINRVYGLASTDQKIALLSAVFSNDLTETLRMIRDYEAHGIDLKRLTSELMDVLKDAVIYGYTQKESLLKVLNKSQAVHLSAGHKAKDLLRMIEDLMKAIESYKTAQSVASYFEIACMDMMAAAEPVSFRDEPKPIETEKPKAARAPAMVSAPEPVKEETFSPEIETMNLEEPAEESEPADACQEDNHLKNNEIPEMDEDLVLRLLVQCNKDAKAEDTEKLKKLTEGLMMDRYAAALRQTTIAASGADCILFSVSMPAIANNINEPKFNRGLYEYLKRADIDKMPFAACESVLKRAVSSYRTLYAEKNLPERIVIERYKEDKTEEEKINPEQRMKDIFGDDMVEVIDEGKD
ncbi:MAG: DNA polymerase III subunit gamma/tau [Erysipelotrichia bacterium]|nr:DNA polymerase III subunit gamma/tau [Erysipelotrichia bacterium]